MFNIFKSVAAQSAVENATKYNPWQGIKSVAELSNSLRKEVLFCVDLREYSKPTREQLTPRIKNNLGQFKLMYSSTVLFFFIYFLLTSPVLLGGIILLGGLWIYLFQITNPDETLKVGTYEFGKTEKFGIMITLTLLITLFGGLFSYIFYVGFTSGFFILSHASFRNEIEIDPLDELADIDNDNFV